MRMQTPQGGIAPHFLIGKTHDEGKTMSWDSLHEVLKDADRDGGYRTTLAIQIEETLRWHGLSVGPTTDNARS